MSRLPKFNGSKIPPPAYLSKPGASQVKEAVFKSPETKLTGAKSTTQLNKALHAPNVPRMAGALKSSMSQRSKSAAELRHPVVAVKTNPTVRPTATVSATNQKPAKRAGAPLTTVKPNMAKQTPPKAKPKTTAKPAPYDYKARFGLLKENHDTFKANQATLKDKFNEQSNEIEVLTSNNEQMKSEIASARSELEKQVIKKNSERVCHTPNGN